MSEDLDAYRARAREWIAANLERRAPSGRNPMFGSDHRTDAYIAQQRALQRRLWEAGYAGITWPTEYGGQGLGPEYQRAFDEEAKGYARPDFGVIGGTTFGVCATTMLAHGSPEFLERHIPRVLAGDELIAQFFSDPEAGSDLAGVRTQAVKDGERWILNGSKIWSSGAYHADYGLCLARTNWDAPKHRGLTWFAVPTNANGVTVQRIKQINGDAEFCQEFFDDVELTDDDVVGQVDDGWTVTQTMLFFERGGGGGSATPPAKPSVIAPDLVDLATAAGRLGDPHARDLLAKAHVDDLVRAAMARRVGALMATDPARGANIASYGKLMSGVFDPRRAAFAMEIATDHAVVWDSTDSPAADAATGLLNGRFMAIAGGTCEMQRNSIGERVLGLPREPSFDSRKPFRDVLRDAQNWSGRVG
ncbi:acyl-CoA dehydrogenase family protein [Cryptosporangium aurantiacum]|uniref:Acyl-CoA dehydrogenase n=1 Tax=Cryptosporangium aurantiacum TaxID=134849 RepID=A0A1M7R341_9ACTN|nr:acyl-CoA dehydrogenase family protein [Cryptosporangium aurantiacum]SHN39342.1 Acyl-CoA dehydrogenase [Cryptosporangium aurantiacum]